ncbi:MAG: M67 family metallopeptidase [Anaerolineaceae bacterium]|nr:M67 family metallopeptidase [Anaerolineaceae bacterium]
MKLAIAAEIMKKIQLHGEAAYPEEGAGFLLGKDNSSGGLSRREVLAILELPNRREDGSRHNRYLIGPKDYLQAEDEADRLGLTLVGVFHSHPDHPDRPSDFDRDWAQPWFSYLITSVQNGRAVSSRSWRLLDDRSGFEEENIRLTSGNAVLFNQD